MDIGLTDPWITLTIKAPNQQINDQTVKCKLDWSVAKLKGYLHETYPNKPKTEDQRIIYSGQLLTDGVILKDILRPYDEDGQLNRTVHLVCATSSFCIPPKEKLKSEQNVNEVNKKCPKHNNINDGASTSGINGSSGASTSSDNEKETNTTQNQKKSVNSIPMTPEQLASEQILLIHKMYAIKMAAYWQSVANRIGHPIGIIQVSPRPVVNEPPQDVPINNNNNNQPADQNNVLRNNEENNVRRNNPNINVQDAGPNQDWLDWLYVSSRVFIFISVLYFYSSPGRFIVVAGFAFLLYLYQSGILRHINEHNRRRFQPVPQEPQVDDNRNVSPEQDGNTDDANARQNERLITTLWTLISTFFTSLIPQQPDVI